MTKRTAPVPISDEQMGELADMAGILQTDDSALTEEGKAMKRAVSEYFSGLLEAPAKPPN